MNETMGSITALILAGGEGTRLRPAVSEVPKVLAPVNGRPFLHYLLDQLSDFGVNHVVVCTGYRGDQIREEIGSNHATVQIEYSQEPQKLGTGGAIRCALPSLRSEQVFVLNGDSYCDVDLARFQQWHLSRGIECSLVVVHRSDTARFGRVKLSKHEQIEELIEKDERQLPGWINAGVYLVSTELIREISEGRAISIETELFPGWLSNGLYGYKTNAAFLDIGTPESYARAPAFFEMLSRANPTRDVL